MPKNFVIVTLNLLFCLALAAVPLHAASAAPAPNPQSSPMLEKEIFIGFLSPTPEYICVGEKAKVFEYYFINDVKAWLKKPEIPLGELSDTVIRIRAKLGTVTPSTKNLGGGIPVGGSKELKFTYKPTKSGDEVITIEVNVGSSRAVATFEFPVDICRYKVKWTQVQTINIDAINILSVDTGDGEMVQAEDGSLNGSGKETSWTSLLSTDVPGCQEVAPRQGEGTFEISGTTAEDGQMQASLALSSFPISAHRINCPDDGWGAAPAVTVLTGTGKFNAPTGSVSSVMVELNRAQPILLAMAVIPRRQP